jgi:hypothetical protein
MRSAAGSADFTQDVWAFADSPAGADAQDRGRQSTTEVIR